MKRCNPDVVAALNRRVSVGPARGPSVTAWGPSGLHRPAQSATTRRAGSLRKAPRGGLLRQAPHAIPPRTRQYPFASGSSLTRQPRFARAHSICPGLSALAFHHTKTRGRSASTEHGYAIARGDGRAMSSHTAGGGGLLCELSARFARGRLRHVHSR